MYDKLWSAWKDTIVESTTFNYECPECGKTHVVTVELEHAYKGTPRSLVADPDYCPDCDAEWDMDRLAEMAGF